MSSKYCPRAPLGQYQPGSSFSGPIMSLFQPERGIFYALNNDLFEKFEEFEKHVPKDICKDVPKFGAIFLFVNQQRKCYRAYRMNSNPANTNAVRAFLFDVGTEIYRNFKVGSFYKMPESFYKTQPMAILCYVDSYSHDGEYQLRSEFLKQSLYKSFQYVVKRDMQVEIAAGKNQKCLVVTVIDLTKPVDESVEANEHTSTLKGSSANMQSIDVCEDYSKYWLTQQREVKSHPKLTYLDDETDYVGFSSDQIAIPNLPALGSKIIVIPTQIVGPNTLYALYSMQEDLTAKTSTDAMSLYVWMNERNVVNGYHQLETKPKAGDMVLAIARDSHFHRGRVVNTAGEFFQIFFVDLGHTLSINFRELYKFPTEFASLPAQVAHLTIENMISLVDSLHIVEAMKDVVQSFGVAEVMSSSFNGISNLSVKLYTQQGEDFVDYVKELMHTVQ